MNRTIRHPSHAPKGLRLPIRLSTLTRAIAPVVMFFAKISFLALVSPVTRFDALDAKTIMSPSALMFGLTESSVPIAFAEPELTRTMALSDISLR